MVLVWLPYVCASVASWLQSADDHDLNTSYLRNTPDAHRADNDRDGTLVGEWRDKCVRRPPRHLHQVLLLLLLLWLKDGLLLFTNRVDLRGETVVVNEVDEDDGGGAEGDLADIDDADADGEFKPIKPPPTWRHFRTHLGTSYYYDPATEMIHYLSRTGQGNYVVDPVYNCTLSPTTR